MKTIPYHTILPPATFQFEKNRHEQARWDTVEIDDLVVITSLFSTRVVFWTVIMTQVMNRARVLNADFTFWDSKDENGMDTVCIRMKEKDPIAPTQALSPGTPKPNGSPNHRGSFYGPEEGIFPLPGWNLITVPSQYDPDELQEPFNSDRLPRENF